MTIDQLRKAHQAHPFEPFRIHLADGRQFEVRHPELLAVVPPGRTIIVVPPDGKWAVIDLLLVTSLESADGRSRRRTARRN
ncbi:MAG TPA: hypothetical protein VGM03_10165 [Phycisphaerae bacterium]|jgi:hypothetical protein